MTRESSTSKDWLVVLAKQPLRGHSKTRLARSIGEEQAQGLAEAFVLDTLALVNAAREKRQALLAYSPPTAEPWFVRHAPSLTLIVQADGDLGARIHSATSTAFARGAERCVVIGTDMPHLERARIDEAFESLATDDLVLGPSEDGGYYLIALKREDPRLFQEIDWSTAHVLGQTMQRATELGLTVKLLPTEFDIDDADDLTKLRGLLEQRASVAVRTRALL